MQGVSHGNSGEVWVGVVGVWDLSSLSSSARPRAVTRSFVRRLFKTVNGGLAGGLDCGRADRYGTRLIEPDHPLA